MDQGRFIPGIGLCLWFAIVYPACAAAIEFQPLLPLELSKTAPSDRVVADFNNDGHLDLVVVMSGIGGGDGGVSVLLGDGNGGFANRDFPTGAYNAWGVAAGDFNRDRNVDLALTATVTSAGVASRDIHILLGDGAGGFVENTTVQALQDTPHAVTAGDFNEDGILDLVIGATQSTSFHAGAADATFGAGQLLSGSSNLSGDQLFAADFNGDTHLDVGSRQAVYLGAGNGSFTRSAFFAVGAKASADLNGDGRLDLISAAGSSLQIWFGKGDGSFVVNATITVGANLAAAAAADIDGDGHTDVALVSAGDTAVAVLLNNGDGTLAAPQAFATGAQPRLLAAADWDEDGFLDLIVPYNNLGNTPYASRLMQVPPAPSPGRLQLGANAYSVSEAGPGVAVTVTRTGGSLGIVSIDYATSDGSATAGGDYTAAMGTLTFADGIISQSLVVPILEDTVYEGNETFTLTLSNATGGAAIGTPAGSVLTITDNDAPPPSGSLQFGSATYTVREDGVTVNVTVTRSGGSFGAVTVDYASGNGSAAAGSDYSATLGTLSFADGVISQSFDIAVLDDTLYEGSETVNLILSNVTGGASLGTQSSSVLTITENDPTPPSGSLQFSAVSYQVAENTGGGLLTVTRSGGSFGAVTVDYATSNGTAVAGSDYTFTSGTLSFADGEVSKAITVVVADDVQYEGNETLSLTLSNAQGGASLGTPTIATMTIIDNDPPPSAGSLQFSGATYSAAENAGSVLITVTRSGGSSGAVAVDYATSDGTATAGSDYTFASGTLSFAGGEISKTFSVVVVDDTQYEGSESLNVTLSNAQGGASLGTPTSTTVTITDNDSPPPAGSLQFSGATYSAAESAGSVLITVTRSGGSFGAVAVDYATSDGTATAGSDYTFASGTLSFADGEISKTFSVIVVDDTQYEGNESLTVMLSNVQSGATLGTPISATVPIADNDSPPPAGSLQFSSSTHTVSEDGVTVNITVVRTGGSFGAVTVDYASGDLTAMAGSDYVATSGTLTLGDGVVSAAISVTVLDDATFEGDETVGLLLSNPTDGAALGAEKSAVLIIAENDAPPPEGSLQFSGAAYSVAEDAGSVTITVTRSGGSSGEVSVNYSTADLTATGGLDYSVSTGMLTFSDGETSKTFTVPILDDSVYEGDEQLQLHLVTPTGGAALGTIRDATLTLRDNDAPPPAGSLQLSGAGYVFTEGDGTVSITVTRTGGSAGAVGVDYAFSNGTATGGQDYVSSNGNLLFAEGVTSAAIELIILEDLLQEPPETLVITLTSATGGAAIGQPSAAEITLLDNEPQPPAASPLSGKGGGGAVDYFSAVLLSMVMIFRRIVSRKPTRSVPTLLL